MGEAPETPKQPHPYSEMYGTMEGGEGLDWAKGDKAPDGLDGCVLSLGNFFATAFARIGRHDARRPALVIGVALGLVAVLVGGMAFVDINSNPNAIWVPPTSITSLQQNQFNAVFNPFYRIEQAIFSLKPEAAYVCPRPTSCLPTLSTPLVFWDGRPVAL